METFIKITRISGSGADPMKFELEFSNGKQSAGAEIYIGHDFFENSSKALKEFPRHSSDKFRWEQGSERLEDRTGDYFRFNVLQRIRWGKAPFRFVTITRNLSLSGEYPSFAFWPNLCRSIISDICSVNLLR